MDLLFEFTPAVFSVLFVAFVVLNFTLIVFLGNRNTMTQAFVRLGILIALWMLHVALWYGAREQALALFGLRTAYFYGVLTGISFYMFCRTFPKNIPFPNKERHLLFSIEILLFFAYFTPYIILGLTTLFGDPVVYRNDLLVSHMFPSPGPQWWGYSFGDHWFLLFDGPFTFFWVLGFVVLFKRSLSLSDPLDKKRLSYMFWAMVIGIIPPTLANVILPHFGIFSLHLYGLFSSIAWISLLLYSILRYDQMNIRVVYAELLTVTALLLLSLSIFI